MDEYDRQRVTNLTQTFTATGLRNAARAYGVRMVSAMTKWDLAVHLVQLNKDVSDVRRVLRKETS